MKTVVVRLWNAQKYHRCCILYKPNSMQGLHVRVLLVGEYY